MRSYKFYLQDILESIQKIETYTAYMSYVEFESNTLVVDAVLRNLEVIGEATRNLPIHIRAQYPDVDWRESIAMRNIISHEYFGVDLGIIWETLHTDLQKFKRDIIRVIEAS